jgi:hemoglobin-like flavoprotein
MGPLVPSNIFYDRETQRPKLSLVGVTNFLWHFFEPDTFRRIVGPKNGTYLLPEKCAGREADAYADQYFLGMLALELLESRMLFVVAENEQPADPLALLERAPWAKRHQQFRAIVACLLAKDPLQRFRGGMSEVLANLRALEDASRALAKYSFCTYVVPEGEGEAAGLAFSRQFYKKFFERAPAVEKLFREAQRQRTAATAPAHEPPAIPDDMQHRKLMDGLKAVLNFRPGGQPSSIDSVAARHAGFHLDAGQLADFEASFIDTLEARVRQTAEGAAELEEIVEAWQTLFAPVRAEMLGYTERHGHSSQGRA